jgi:hypothetical protein
VNTKLVFAALLVLATYALFANFSSVQGSTSFSGASPDNKQDQPSPTPKPHERLEDHGCCVLKKSKYKPEWDYSDDEVRKLCVETAGKSGFDYDFYKDQKCEEVKKQGN